LLDRNLQTFAGIRFGQAAAAAKTNNKPTVATNIGTSINFTKIEQISITPAIKLPPP
jgi:hypothetical protein